MSFVFRIERFFPLYIRFEVIEDLNLPVFFVCWFVLIMVEVFLYKAPMGKLNFQTNDSLYVMNSYDDRWLNFFED